MLSIILIIILTILTIVNVVLILRLIKLSKIRKMDLKEQEINFKKFLNTVHDEHIFSITHELRSPLAVILSSTNNQYTTLKHIFNSLSPTLQNQYKDQFKELKENNEYIKNQAATIESFIKYITEHASYISENEDEKTIDMHKYLLSIIINSLSFSRNMRIFKNNIGFSDIAGLDFHNISITANPYDLNRIITNLLTNAADAVSESYKIKKSNDINYTPKLKIYGIRNEGIFRKIYLNEKFIRINGNKKEKDGCHFYILIHDNGPGISEENITKIFKYGGFTTKNKECDSQHYGLGLKLSIQLATKNNIKMFVKTDDSGTIFALGFNLEDHLYDKTKTKKSDESSDTFDMSNKTSDECKEFIKNYCTMETSKITKRVAIISGGN